MLRGLRRQWHSWRQKRRQRNLNKRLEEVEAKVRESLREKHEELATSPVTFAEKVLSVKPFPYQASLLEDRSKRIVACMGRQTGKTTTIAMKALFFTEENPNVTVLITSPSLRQSMIMFDRITSFVYLTAFLRNKVVRATRTVIQFENGSRIIALPCSENLLRGYTAHMCIMDEAAFMPEEVITQIIFPMLSTTDGYAVFLSTPWGKDHIFYRAFMNPAYSVHRVKSDECPLIKSEFLEEMRANMTREAYLMEYEAEFVEALNSFFPQDLIRQAIDPNLEFYASLETDVPEGEYYAGCDFGKLQDHSALTILKREGESIRFVYLYEFPLETAYTEVIGHLARANQKFKLIDVQVDQTGVGESVLEELKNQGVPAEGLTFTVKTKENLLTCLKIAMENGRLRMPYDRRLCQQINEQQYAYSKSGHLQFTHPESSHDDMLWSLALGVWAATMKREEPGRLVGAWGQR